MQIIKPLQLGVLHRSFRYLNKDIFAVSIPIAFSLKDGDILLEQKLWATVGEQMQGQIFDTGIPKAQGEVIAQGSFFSSDGQPVEAGSVRLQIGTIDKELAVFGQRHWQTVLGGSIASRPIPSNEIALGYDNAFGGEEYPLNLSGKGHKPIREAAGEMMHYLPQVEYPHQLVTSPYDQPQPAGFSRTDLLWQPRLSRAGTYDEKYLAEQMPGLPDDIDWRYFNDAAQDQWLDGFFSGNEHYAIHNMHPEHPVFSGQLPPIYGRAFVNQQIDKQLVFKEITTHLDTVWFFPTAAMGVMIYRGSMQIATDDATDITALMIACESREDTPRTQAHYQDQMAKRSNLQESYKYALYSAPLIAKGMTCGFKQLQDENDFPLEMLFGSNMETYAEGKIEHAEQQQSAAQQQVIEQLEAAGIDPAPYIEKINSPDKSPEQKKIESLLETMLPGIVTNPANPDLSKLDLSVIDDIQKLLEDIKDDNLQQSRQALQQQIDALKANSKNSSDDNIVNTITDEIAAKLIKIDQAPAWPRPDIRPQLDIIREQYQVAEQEIARLKTLGIAEDQLPSITIDLESLENKLLEAEKNLQQSYLVSAHLIGQGSSPHEGREEELKQQLLRCYRAGDSLTDQDFACLDLAGEDLSQIDLSGCYLEGANLSGTNLSGAILNNAVMAGVNLSNANLSNASCVGTNIGAANLTNTTLSGANLSRAELGKSQLINTTLDDCQLDEMHFLDTVFDRVSFDRASMKQCNFIDADLSACSFVGTDLTEANFVNPILEGANFQSAIINAANFVEAKANNACFCRTTMINSRFVNSCELNGADFSEAIVDQSCLRDNAMRNANFSGAQLNATDFSGAHLQAANFSRATGIGAQFMKSDLTGANFSNANCMEASLFKAQLAGVNFSGANLYCVNFIAATLGENQYVNANLDQTILQDWRP